MIKKLKTYWRYGFCRAERIWILFCTTGTFGLAVYSVVKYGHL